VKRSAVMPGLREANSPEAKNTGPAHSSAGDVHGFRARHFAPPRNHKRLCVVALASALAAAPAQAIVGGADDTGPLAQSSVMVLSSKGGVCSAVIVDVDVVLTAAHCATGSGQYRVHWRDEDGTPQLIEPAAKTVHPGYDAKAIEARRRSIDLALIRVPQKLPDRFAVATLSAASPGAGAMVRFGGYGVAKEGDARSTGTFRTVELAVVEPYGPSRVLVWAKGDGPGAGACMGDSGGPIAEGGAVVAIATWAKGPKGRGCGEISQGVLIGPDRAWIDRTLAAWGRKARWQ
jgi:hypothetical protein